MLFFLLKIKYFEDTIITIGFDDFYSLQIYYNKVLLNLYTYTTLNNIKIPTFYVSLPLFHLFLFQNILTFCLCQRFNFMYHSVKKSD